MAGVEKIRELGKGSTRAAARSCDRVGEIPREEWVEQGRRNYEVVVRAVGLKKWIARDGGRLLGVGVASLGKWERTRFAPWMLGRRSVGGLVSESVEKLELRRWWWWKWRGR